jgi:hypothetical protein
LKKSFSELEKKRKCFFACFAFRSVMRPTLSILTSSKTGWLYGLSAQEANETLVSLVSFSDQGGVSTTKQLFTAQTAWTLGLAYDESGKLLYVSDGREPVLSVFTLSGESVRTIQLPFIPYGLISGLCLHEGSLILFRRRLDVFRRTDAAQLRDVLPWMHRIW